MDTILAGHGEAISAVVSLEVEDEELIERLLKRGQVSGRSDDNRETIEARLKVYYNQTLPLKDYYDKQNKLKKIQGTGSIEEIFESIRKEIDPLVN